MFVIATLFKISDYQESACLRLPLEREFKLGPGSPYSMGMIGTVDLLVLTSSNQLLFLPEL